MNQLRELAALVESKSGAPPINCDMGGFVRLVGFDVSEMKRNGYDVSVIEEHETFNDKLAGFFSHAVLGEYLGNLSPVKSYEASGVWVGTLEDAHKSVFPPDSTPESQLFLHGYFPIAGDGGGNSICFHLSTEKIVFAHHELTEEIIDGELNVLSEDLESFLNDLLNDKLTDVLESLD